MGETVTVLVEALQYLPSMVCGLGKGCRGGLALNILLALAAIPLSVLLGVVLGSARALGIFPFCLAIALYTELIKTIPLLLVIFWLHYSLPVFLGVRPPLFVVAVSALVLFGTANVAEVFRSGLDSVGRAEIENSRLHGMSRWQCARLIIIPQVVHTMLPALLGVTVTLFKDSSMVFVIGLVELTHTGMIISNRYPDKLIAMYVLIGAGYSVIALSLAQAASALRERQSRKLGKEDSPSPSMPLSRVPIRSREEYP